MEEAVAVLGVAAIRDQVVMSYEDFFDTVSEGKGRKVSRKGKAREDEVWGPEIFGEAMERVFQVGQVIGDGQESGRKWRTETVQIGVR